MIRAIREEANRRGITRVCHFTPSRNLAHIAAGQVGILATKHLSKNEREVLNPTDLQRLDGYTGHICCSIEYPNAWYLDRARAQDTLFRDWVILLISPHYLWTEGTMFCSRNAATGYGIGVAGGEKAFVEMFATGTVGAAGRTYIRSSKHLTCCPTDEQAEVLIPDVIEIEKILGVAVSSDDQAERELVRLELAGVNTEQFQFVVAPVLFSKYSLSTRIRSGKRPEEILWRETLDS